MAEGRWESGRGRIFRRVTRMGSAMVRLHDGKVDLAHCEGLREMDWWRFQLVPHEFGGGRALVFATLQEANWNRSSSCWDMSLSGPNRAIPWLQSSGFGCRSMIASESNWNPSESRGSGKAADKPSMTGEEAGMGQGHGYGDVTPVIPPNRTIRPGKHKRIGTFRIQQLGDCIKILPL